MAVAPRPLVGAGTPARRFDFSAPADCPGRRDAQYAASRRRDSLVPLAVARIGVSRRQSDPGCGLCLRRARAPQSASPDSQWLADFPDEEERFSACHSIGNLALIDYSENAKITNLDFYLKLPTLQEQSKKYRTLSGIADKPEWKAAQIRDRASRMIALACKELNIPRAARS